MTHVAAPLAPPTPQTVPFRRTGLLALEPSAFGLEFLVAMAPGEPFELVANGRAAVVEVAGPLTYDGFCTVSYAQIRARFEAALASDAACVVLKLRSPGGEVAGVFDCARMLPQLAAAAGKRFVAYTDTQCCSAAYALAVGADEVILSDTASIGSIGVINVACETTRLDAAMGLRFEIFASGARKADGNPHQAWTDEARASAQAGIDAAAAIFFEWVRQRRSIDPQPLEGASFMGAKGVALGLADRVLSWDALLRELAETESQQGATQGAIDASSASSPAMPKAEEDKKDDKKDAKASRAAEYRKMLKAAADDGDEKAKKALSALDEDGDKKAEGDEKDEPEKKDEKSKKAESDDEEKKAEGDDEEKKASASDPLVAGLMAQVRQQGEQLAAIAKREADQARASFLATRPDLNPELVKALADKPLAEVQAIVNAIPKAGNPLAPATGSMPRGANTGELAYRANPDFAELDQEFGLAQAAPRTHVEGNKLFLHLGGSRKGDSK